MTRPALSVITVCMNRQQHLLATARKIAAWPLHQEHLILDWSSRVPVERAQLPPDPRIRLERVDGEQRWNLCRAYNLAARLARGQLLLKLDADCWPEQLDPGFVLADDEALCWFGSGPDGRLGQFLMPRTAFEAVGGFNEVLQGYGFDDKDLKARLMSLSFNVRALPQAAIGVKSHSIHERVSRNHLEAARASAYEESLSFALRRSTAMSNRHAAALFPWTCQRDSSYYIQRGQKKWCAVQSSIPRLSVELEAELLRLRRKLFWGSFLCIPEDVVRRLPMLLLGSERNGEFKILWWHRLYWCLVSRPLVLVVSVLDPGFWKGIRR